jgi:hypothetical protein
MFEANLLPASFNKFDVNVVLGDSVFFEAESVIVDIPNRQLCFLNMYLIIIQEDLLFLSSL